MFNSKKSQLVLLGALSLICSRLFFVLLNDPEGPNLLIVFALAVIIYLPCLILICYNIRMKKIFILIVILAVGVLGYLFFRKSPDEAMPNNADTQNEVVAGKIDINAVCEGALSYMTFTDGAAADAFVAECKEGKRPEVIEKYKADMNLGDGAAI